MAKLKITSTETQPGQTSKSNQSQKLLNVCENHFKRRLEKQTFKKNAVKLRHKTCKSSIVTKTRLKFHDFLLSHSHKV